MFYLFSLCFLFSLNVFEFLNTACLLLNYVDIVYFLFNVQNYVLSFVIVFYFHIMFSNF